MRRATMPLLTCRGDDGLNEAAILIYRSPLFTLVEWLEEPIHYAQSLTTMHASSLRPFRFPANPEGCRAPVEACRAICTLPALAPGSQTHPRDRWIDF